jgi:hypothetical protein
VEEGQQAQVSSERWNLFAIVGAIAATGSFVEWPLMRWISPYRAPEYPCDLSCDATSYYVGQAALALIIAVVAIVLLLVGLLFASRERRGTRIFASAGGVLALVATVAAIRELVVASYPPT